MGQEVSPMSAGASQHPAGRSLRVVVAALIGLALVLVAAAAGVRRRRLQRHADLPDERSPWGRRTSRVDLQILNCSTAAESTGNVTINSINFVPACGTTCFVGDRRLPGRLRRPRRVPAQPDRHRGGRHRLCRTDLHHHHHRPGHRPGDVHAHGRPGRPDPAGHAQLGLPDRLHVQRPQGPGAIRPAVVPPNSLVTDQIGFASGTSAVNGNTGTGSGSSSVTVTKADPTITTTATGTATVGTPTTDTATLTAAPPPAPAPTGTITFSLYGPNNATCTGAPAFVSMVPVSSGGGAYTSAPFTPTAPGTYRWVAAYSGDANNAAATTACGDAGETTTVTPATPAIVTTASGRSPSAPRSPTPRRSPAASTRPGRSSSPSSDRTTQAAPGPRPSPPPR